MSLQVNNELDFKTEDDRNDYLKTRVESLGLSVRTQNALVKANVRTIGGIIRKTEPLLLEIDGLGINGVSEIKAVLSNVFDLSIPNNKSREEYRELLPNFSVNTETVEIKAFLKEQIKTLGLSPRTNNALTNSGIRTIGGLIKKKMASLFNIRGLGHKGVDEIKTRLESVFNISIDQRTEAAVNDPVQDTNLFQENSINIFSTLVSHDKGDILSTFASHFNLKKDDIINHSRKKDGTGEIRDMIIYFLREYGEMSFPAIGRLLHRDHTTIMYSYEKIKDKMNTDVDFETKFAILIAKAQSIKNRKIYVEQTLIPQIVKLVRSEIDIKKPKYKFKEISGRDTKILELYKEGLTLENIAKVIKLTRERVRQIVDKTIRQWAINESFSKGFELDAEVLIEEEKKNRVLIRKKNRQEVPTKQKVENRWSRYYISCKSCGTTVIPHVRNGLCEQCIGQFRGDRREKIISSHNNKCDSCGMFRHEAITNYGRDFYITKDQKVFCRKCFLGTTGKTLGHYKNYAWSRFYSKCKLCGTTSVPHAKRGLCIDCDDNLTNEERDKIITQHSSKCDSCGLGRDEARKKLGRDFYLTKSEEVLCRTCFQRYLRVRKES